jgi:hypothetical protein
LIIFLFGWKELLVIRIGSVAALSFIFAEYLQSFFFGGQIFNQTHCDIDCPYSIYHKYVWAPVCKKIQDISTLTKMLAFTGMGIFCTRYRRIAYITIQIPQFKEALQSMG